jgi:parallel beta-helix repeat protein
MGGRDMFMKRTRSRYFKAFAVLAIIAVFVGTTVIAPVTPALAAPGDSIPIWEDYLLTSDMTFTGNGFVIEADGITLDLNGHTITGSGQQHWNGVQLGGRTGVTIRNGTIQGFANGVVLWGSNDNVVKDIVSIDNLREGILLYQNSDRNHVVGNTADRNGLSGIDLWYQCDDNVIQNNTCNNNRLNGITLGASDRNSIVGNTTNENASDGVSLWDRNGDVILGGSDHNLVKGNSSSLNHSNGFIVGGSEGNSLIGNTASGNTWNGVVLINGSNENLVKEGTSTGARNGINLDVTSTGNTIQANVISVTSTGIGIGGIDNDVIENRVTGSELHGIALWPTSSGSVIRDNNISSVSGSSLPGTGAGIAVFGHGSQIIDNTIEYTRIGIGLFVMAYGNIVKDNSVSHTIIHGIGILGHDNEIACNAIDDSVRSGIGLGNGATGNLIKKNRVSKSGEYGIGAIVLPPPPNSPAVLDPPPIGNTIAENTVRKSGLLDLFDWRCEDGGDPANVWTENKYRTDNFPD